VNGKSTTSYRPSQWRPATTIDFIGKTRKIADILARKIADIKPDDTLKILFWGPPGVGKSALAENLAAQIAGHSCCIESLNGQSMNVERVRAWMEAQHYRPLWGRTVKLVDEIDAASAAAHNELRTYLDRMKHGAFLATTNATIDELPVQLQTRVQPYEFEPIPPTELGFFLGQFGLPEREAFSIAQNCAGCVRAALLDAETWLDKAQ